ncbi:hypothetical protein D3C87_1064130 [compost metagenome]
MKITVFLISLLLFSEAYANNSFIPNYYRSYRSQNRYSAVGWSDRKEANLEYGAGKETTDDGTSETDSDKSEYLASVFYRVNEAFNVEAGYFGNKEEPDGADSKENKYLRLGLGYQFGDFAVGFNHQSADQNDLKANLNSLGLGYRINGNIYLGIGYTNSRIYTGPGETIEATSIGGGYVWGDVKNPTAAVEVDYEKYVDSGDGNSATVKGIWNQEAIQYNAKLALVDQVYKGTVVALGLDYQLEHIYFAPRITLLNQENKNTDAKRNDTQFDLEVGYRAHAQWEAFVRYNSQKLEVGDEDTTGSLFTVGGAYFF